MHAKWITTVESGGKRKTRQGVSTCRRGGGVERFARMNPAVRILVVLALACLWFSPAFAQGIGGVTRRTITPAPSLLPPTPPPRLVVQVPEDPVKAAAARAEAERKAVEFQKKRAEAGSAIAQYDLGLRHLSGDGVEQDAKLGRALLEKSARQGNKQAAKKLAALPEEEPAGPASPRADTAKPVESP